MSFLSRNSGGICVPPRRERRLGVALALLVWHLTVAAAAAAAANPASSSIYVGPYNDHFLQGGIGATRRPLAADSPLSAAGVPWSMSGPAAARRRASSGHGNRGGDRRARCVAGTCTARRRAPAFIVSPSVVLTSTTVIDPGPWYAIAATFDGTTARLYADGREITAGAASSVRVAPVLELAPVAAAAPGG